VIAFSEPAWCWPEEVRMIQGEVWYMIRELLRMGLSVSEIAVASRQVV